MPVFDGTDSDSCLFRADHYFKIHNLTDSEKLMVEMISFDGPALDWAIRDGILVGRFLTIELETTVEEYRNCFGKLLVPVAFLSTVVLEETFMNALNPWLKFEVETLKPIRLAQMMKLALKIENRELVRRECGLVNSYDAQPNHKNPQPLKGKEQPRHVASTAAKELTTTSNWPMQIVQNQEEELKIVEEEYFDAETEIKQVEVQNVENLNIELSTYSVVGLTNLGTMKVKGKIEEAEVVILIDCRATQNFIVEKLVTKLGLTPQETPNYGVILGSELGGVDIIVVECRAIEGGPMEESAQEDEEGVAA
ncbi:transposon Tf2-1 polyprotein isoform X1 [Cucumis melo var. makuwa]|uniref:Transposon Tf2-1 polyprotein isoform X1 n=1 Tax=Cucumis melo var. makuwa TaxID=1194695 RepID=A0A5A7TMU4_CUCMM|nr:transposon Tf2-1 polyprotein isoform X1 [Cucumis melo var. makuwa]TYK05303.1 transposon Tf2-1 polyprotein isoform X1 [Cucumis melo var. makuwa]